MERLFTVALSNAVMATVLALLVAALGRACRRPALMHGLWLLVLLKLVTPPLVEWPWALPDFWAAAPADATAGAADSTENPAVSVMPTDRRDAALADLEGMVSALAVNRSLSFSELKKLLETTDGNLSVHARRLEHAQYVTCAKFFEGRVPRTEYRLTDRGRELTGLLSALRALTH